MLETLSDIVEQVADEAGIYGAHNDQEKRPCRGCWTSDLTDRIWKAVRLEQALERGRTT